MNYFVIVVFQKQDSTYYFKKIRSLTRHYVVGEENGYGHKVILVIDLLDLFNKKKKSLRNRVLDRLISRLEKMKRR